MEERRSASGLFVLPASLPEEHPLVVTPEPEPEPEPTLEEATGTLLDHYSVRCGREVCRFCSNRHSYTQRFYRRLR